MAIKRVLLPLGAAGRSFEHVAEAAFLLGRLHEAQVRCLFVQRSQLSVPFRGEYVDPDAMRRIFDDARKRLEEEGSAVEKQFRAVARRHPSVDGDYMAREGEIGETVAHGARLADISVISGIAGDDDEWNDLYEAVLFRSGRPVLILPPESVPPQQFDRVVVAWKESVEAARAVAAAQPFLVQARQVHIVSVGEDDAATTSLRDVEDYLQLHHAEVRSEGLPPRRGKDVADALQHKAEVLGGALLVMGAYSRARWREQIFGGVTNSVLRQPRVPVLMMR